jgi:hypothetical protein
MLRKVSPRYPRSRSIRPRLRRTFLEILEPRTLLASKALVFTAPSGNGADTMILQLNGTTLEILDNGSVVASQALARTSSVTITGANNENDSLTVDYSFGGFFSVTGGVSFAGGTAAFDQLSVVGTGATSGTDIPSGTTVGSGSMLINGSAITYSGLESTVVSSMASFGFTTALSANVLTVDSPAAQQNRISGTSQGAALVPLTFSAVTSFTLDTATNDGTFPADSVTLASSGLVASGLQNFTVNTGAGNDTLTLNAGSFSLPVVGGSFRFNGGAGTDQIVASADVNFTLSDTSLSSSGGGTVSLTSVEAARLIGGPSGNTFTVSNWSGAAVLDGGAGSDSYFVDFNGTGAGTTTINDSGAVGSDSLVINGTSAGDSMVITGTQVSRGSEAVNYAGLESLNVNALGGDDTISVTGLAASTTTTVDGGAGTDSASVNFARGYQGSLTLTNFETTAVQIGGDLSGLLAMNGPGLVSPVSIQGSLATGSSLIAEAFGAVAIAQNLAGTLTALVVHNPDNSDVAGTGVLGSLAVGGSVAQTGVINAKDVGSISVTGNFAGNLNVHGSEGDVGSIDIGGSIDASGSIDVVGNVTSVTVTGDDNGVVSVTGSGAIQDMTVGGNLGAGASITSETISHMLRIGLNASGTITALIETDSSGNDIAGTGFIATLQVDGSITQGANILGKDFNALKVGKNFAGNLKVHGSEGDVGSIDIGGSIDASGSIDVVGNVTSVTVTGDDNGVVSVTGSGSIQDVFIGGGLGSTASVITEAITGKVTVGKDVAGTIKGILEHNPDGSVVPGSGVISSVVVSGSLLNTSSIQAQQIGTIAVSGTAAGLVTVTTIKTVTAAAANGPLMLNVTQAGVNYQVQSALVGGGAPPSSVLFNIIYDGTSDVPSLAIRVTNPNPTANQVDLSALSSSNAKFDLARIDSVDTQGIPVQSGIHNVSVSGDLLNTVSTLEQGYFSLPTTAGGVQLSRDNLGAVAVRDSAIVGAVRAASIQAVAFGSLVNATTNISGASATNTDAATMLAAGTLIAQASGVFQVPFDENQPVAFFLATNTSRAFDSRKVLFTDEVADNQSILALITVSANGGTSTIQRIDLLGTGGAIQTQQLINTAITSTGPLGDLLMSNSQGIAANVTAPSIFGTIDASSGPISGVIQTTGVIQTPAGTVSVSADLGRLILNASGQIVGTTLLHSAGALTGQIIVRGRLLSQVNADTGLSGLIATQGDFGSTSVDALGHTLRWGGLLVAGTQSGQVVVLGVFSGDATINGGLKAGRIAVKGGITGNMLTNGVDATAAIVSDGVIGNPSIGTSLTVNGSNKGIIAAKGLITFGKGSPGGNVFNNVGATPNDPNAAAIDAIFTNNGMPLLFDLAGLDLQGLNLILTDLAALKVNNKGNLVGPVK